MTEEIKDLLGSSDIEMAQLGFAIAKERKYGLLEIQKALNTGFKVDVSKDTIVIRTKFNNIESIFLKDPTRLLKLVPICQKK
jgi:hypothetical protein